MYMRKGVPFRGDARAKRDAGRGTGWGGGGEELSTGCSAFEEHSGTREHTSTDAQVSRYHVLTLEDENMFLFGFAFN